MPFVRFTRDKRGYEHFYLVEATTRRGRTRTRVLYWFRTPPNVKVGRRPFEDDDVRRALEAQHPGIEFDWRKIMATAIPSADAEKWRERRRAERAMRRSAEESDIEEAIDAIDSDANREPAESAIDSAAASADVDIEPVVAEDAIGQDAAVHDVPAGAQPQDAAQPELVPRRRRRRRRRRRPAEAAPPLEG